MPATRAAVHVEASCCSNNEIDKLTKVPDTVAHGRDEHRDAGCDVKKQPSLDVRRPG
jgi:hypothetical protein